MTHFTPLASLAGGALIGLAAAGLWLLSGRIAGVSGVLGSALFGGVERGWRFAFVGGLVLGGAGAAVFAPERLVASPHGLALVAVAGLLVGVGTALSNGCTSGHGVCGIGRLSPRSLAATATFMVTGVLAATAVRLLGSRLMAAAIAFLCGLVFAAGLVLSGMTSAPKVIGFLDVGGAWDPSLAFVMLGAIGVFAPVFALSRRRTRPLLAASYELPTASAIDRRLLGGAAIFGVGWGLAGYCPGPALASLAGGATSTLAFVAAMVCGIGLVRLAARSG